MALKLSHNAERLSELYSFTKGTPVKIDKS